MKLNYDENFIMSKLSMLGITKDGPNQDKFTLRDDANTYRPFSFIESSIKANTNRQLDKLIHLLAFNVGLYDNSNRKVLQDDDEKLESILSIYIFFMTRKD